MKCGCGAWTRVLDTRGSERRRECANGPRFWTQEMFVQYCADKGGARTAPSRTKSVERRAAA